MMIKTTKIIILVVAAALLAWFLPWICRFMFSSPARQPFILYSVVTGDFAGAEAGDGKRIFRDFKGNEFTEKQFDAMFPMFYYRQLQKDGTLPEEIYGVAITPQLIAHNNFFFRHSPADVNVRKPTLYPLLESMSGRVDLLIPEDVFRLTDRIEFVDMETNSIDRDKSDRFTKVMTAKGFVFPARVVAGNPTTRKEYDEGYFLTDAESDLFHLKQMQGRPYFKNTEVRTEAPIRYIFPTEYPNRKMFCFIGDEDQNFYVLTAPDYRLVKLPISNFDPEVDQLMIIGDLFNWMFRISSPELDRLYAVDASDYSLVKELWLERDPDRWSGISRYLFPFELSFVSTADKFVHPRLGNFSLAALVLNVVLCGIFLFLCRKSLSLNLSKGLLVIPFGIFLFIPALIFED